MSRTDTGTISKVDKGAVFIPVDDGTYVFKFRTPSDGHIASQLAMMTLRSCATLFKDKAKDWGGFLLAYVRNDGDTVLTASDAIGTVKVTRTVGVDTAILLIEGGQG